MVFVSHQRKTSPPGTEIYFAFMTILKRFLKRKEKVEKYF
jgi:hypothetical protein